MLHVADQDKVPAWSTAAEPYLRDTGKYCAEDSALFDAEYNKRNAGIVNGKCK